MSINLIGTNMLIAASREREHPGQPKGIIALADSVKNIRTLEKLTIRQNHMRGALAGGAVASALAGNETLGQLGLSGGHGREGGRRVVVPNIDNAFAKEFAAGLNANGAMATLNMSNNGLLCTCTREYQQGGYSASDVAAAAVASDIINNAALTSLNLSGNIDSYESAKHVAANCVQNIKSNRTLASLDISDSRLGTPGAWGNACC